MMRSIFVQKPDPLELRRRMSGWGEVWAWLPALVAATVIATESTNTFSAAHTSSWLRPVFEALLGKLTDSGWDLTHHLFRKTGHFCGYGAVCLTFLRAWLLELGCLANLGQRTWRQRACVLAVVSTALIASLDEWHQTYIPSRTGTVQDVVLDTCGATISCVLVWAFVWRRKTGRRDR